MKLGQGFPWQEGSLLANNLLKSTLSSFMAHVMHIIQVTNRKDSILMTDLISVTDTVWCFSFLSFPFFFRRKNSLVTYMLVVIDLKSNYPGFLDPL